VPSSVYFRGPCVSPARADRPFPDEFITGEPSEEQCRTLANNLSVDKWLTMARYDCIRAICVAHLPVIPEGAWGLSCRLCLCELAVLVFARGRRVCCPGGSGDDGLSWEEYDVRFLRSLMTDPALFRFVRLCVWVARQPVCGCDKVMTFSYGGKGLVRFSCAAGKQRPDCRTLCFLRSNYAPPDEAAIAERAVAGAPAETAVVARARGRDPGASTAAASEASDGGDDIESRSASSSAAAVPRVMASTTARSPAASAVSDGSANSGSANSSSDSDECDARANKCHYHICKGVYKRVPKSKPGTRDCLRCRACGEVVDAYDHAVIGESTNGRPLKRGGP
jgi:hypothetical protein